MLKLITAPNPRLRRVSLSVEIIDDQIRRELDEMLVIMHESKGIGLAAVQVGLLKRMLVIDIPTEDERCIDTTEEYKHLFPLKMINPVIVSASSLTESFTEGCLSVPGETAEVVRPSSVTVEYQDITGAKQTLHAKGLLGICIQHEIDHLNGILYVDHLSKLKQDFLWKRYEKQLARV